MTSGGSRGVRAPHTLRQVILGEEGAPSQDTILGLSEGYVTDPLIIKTYRGRDGGGDMAGDGRWVYADRQPQADASVCIVKLGRTNRHLVTTRQVQGGPNCHWLLVH